MEDQEIIVVARFDRRGEKSGGLDIRPIEGIELEVYGVDMGI